MQLFINYIFVTYSISPQDFSKPTNENCIDSRKSEIIYENVTSSDEYNIETTREKRNSKFGLALFGLFNKNSKLDPQNTIPPKSNIKNHIQFRPLPPTPKENKEEINTNDGNDSDIIISEEEAEEETDDTYEIMNPQAGTIQLIVVTNFSVPTTTDKYLYGWG